MKTNRDIILKTLQQNRVAIQNFGVRQLGLFGSAARQPIAETNDLDFLVEFEKKSFDSYMGLKLFLEDLFGCRVDAVMPETLKPAIRQNILNEIIHVSGF